MGWTHRVNEQHSFVVRQGIQEIIVALDERLLLIFVVLARDDVRLVVLEPQTMRFRLSRAKIGELRTTWLDVRLSVGSIDRCIREVGLACEPIVEGLIEDLRQCGILNADETPWPQRGRLRWLWVALSSTPAVFKIASRRAEEIRDLIGEAFVGWLVSDGYAVYRSYKRRQRCLAHLIRKGIALIDGYNYGAARFGDCLVRELRGLIHAVAEQDGPRALNPILARLKRACLLNEDADAAKERALAREILNDWDAITAFVTNPDLPPTNNDAETALRHAVIARRFSFGTRTEEGSRAYAAIISVIETCRRRKIDAWGYIMKAVGTARKGEPRPQPSLPLPNPAKVKGYLAIFFAEEAKLNHACNRIRQIGKLKKLGTDLQ